MPNFPKAINTSILKGLTIKPTGQDNAFISGEIRQCDEHFIYIRITEGFEELLIWTRNEMQFFDVSFFTNRTNYQLQHNTLNWMKDHELFPILIDHPRYAVSQCEVNNITEYKFR